MRWALPLIAALAIPLLFFSCATKPAPKDAQGAPAAQAATAPEAAPAADASRVPGTKPEISFHYRRATQQSLIVASLHEPVPPVRAAASRKLPAVPAPAVTAPAAAAGPPKAAAETFKGSPAEAPAPGAATAPAGKEAPAKAAAPAAAKPTVAKAATVPAKTEATAKAPTPEPKNAASAQAIALDLASADRQGEIARTLSAVQGSRFEIPFEGTGWTYLGEKTAKEGIAYDSRRFEGSSLVFVLNPIKPGDFTLRFQRQDSLRGISYEELVGVSVTPKPNAAAPAGTTAAPAAPAGTAAPLAGTAAAPAGTAGAQPSVAATPGSPPAAAAAPASRVAVPASPAAAGTSAAAAPANSAGAPVSADARLAKASTLATPEAALAAARSELGTGRAEGALDALDRLLTLVPGGTDEALLLYGQALELNGPTKDIKKAYSYYKKLRDNYPESAFWDRAAERASYIERHYFDIR